MSMKKDVVLSPQDQLFLLRLPHNLRGTWMLWRLGIDPYHHMARQTFYSHAKRLSRYGVDIRGMNPYSVFPASPDEPKGHVDESYLLALGKELPKQYAEAEKIKSGKPQAIKEEEQTSFLEYPH